LKRWKEGDAIKIVIRLPFGCALAALLVLSVHAREPDGAPCGVLNATYLIEKQAVELVNGRAEVQAALFLMHDPGGSGTCYYVAAAISAGDIYQGTNAVLLGDRVFPRTILIRTGVIVVEFDDRSTDQPMAAAPSIGKTMYLKLNEGYLTAIKPPVQ
jgi:hypothetical protein